MNLQTLQVAAHQRLERLRLEARAAGLVRPRPSIRQRLARTLIGWGERLEARPAEPKPYPNT